MLLGYRGPSWTEIRDRDGQVLISPALSGTYRVVLLDGKTVEANTTGSMKTLIEGLFPKDRLLDYVRNFIVHEVVNDNPFDVAISGEGSSTTGVAR